MSVTILRRERCGNGWVRFYGAVNGVAQVQGAPLAIRVPQAYTEGVPETIADAEVKEALQDEYERLTLGGGSVFAR